MNIAKIIVYWKYSSNLANNNIIDVEVLYQLISFEIVPVSTAYSNIICLAFMLTHIQLQYRENVITYFRNILIKICYQY